MSQPAGHPYQRPVPAMPSPAPAEVKRPVQVTMAAGLLAVFPVLIAVSIVVSLLALRAATGNADRLVDELAGQGVADPEGLVDSLLSSLRLQAYFGTFIKLVQAIALGVLAVFIFRGAQGARIALYVVAALATVGAVALVVLTGIRRTLQGMLEQRVANAGNVYVDESDVMPGWYDWYNYGVLALSTVLLAIVVVLLTRRVSSAYFRRHQRPNAPRGAQVPYRPPHP